ncbi:MAG: hypothetical protein COB36_14220 [Alphaproteobacteria bacterium]|nr:MAG: hypothetical protein COB36_14220 [Alphaproteobacteria bacterium]
MTARPLIDPAIQEAIDEALADIKQEHPEFARKFARRIALKLTGSFRESDLIDLINDVPYDNHEVTCEG